MARVESGHCAKLGPLFSAVSSTLERVSASAVVANVASVDDVRGHAHREAQNWDGTSKMEVFECETTSFCARGPLIATRLTGARRKLTWSALRECRRRCMILVYVVVGRLKRLARRQLNGTKLHLVACVEGTQCWFGLT